jgi:putative Ca2+/H+ antiporter (TMEM165/GDT1 family)
LPAGFLFSSSSANCRPLHGLWLGLGISLVLEGLQFLLPTRHVNAVDVVANALGCAAGVILQRRLGRWLASFVTEELVLELPLTGALYVLAPLLMLLALSSEGLRVWLLLPLALFAATLLAALYRQRFAQAGRLSPWRFAGYCALAFGGVALPAASSRPYELIAIMTCMAFAIVVGLRRQTDLDNGQRRFEAATVRRGAPWFVAYAFTMIAMEMMEWGDRSLAPLYGHSEALRLLAWIAALTVSGYLLSEVTARGRWPAGPLLLGIAALGFGFGVVMELMRPGPSALLAHGLRAVMFGASAAAGATLHRSQVGLVQVMRGRSVPPSWRPVQS